MNIVDASLVHKAYIPGAVAEIGHDLNGDVYAVQMLRYGKLKGKVLKRHMKREAHKLGIGPERLEISWCFLIEASTNGLLTPENRDLIVATLAQLWHNPERDSVLVR